MFLIVYEYRVRASNEPAVMELHHAWEYEPMLSQGLIAHELLRNKDDPKEFIAIARFESEEAAWQAMENPEHHSWYSHLVRYAEAGPRVTHYESRD